MDIESTPELDAIVQTISFDLPDLKEALKQKTIVTLAGVVVAFAGEAALVKAAKMLKARRETKKSAKDAIIDTTATES